MNANIVDLINHRVNLSGYVIDFSGELMRVNVNGGEHGVTVGEFIMVIYRGKQIEADTNGRFKLVMNEALAMPGAYLVPKGNPAGRENVMKFIRTAQDVEPQLGLLDCLGMTPSNPEAFSKIPENQQDYAITSSKNIDKVVFNDPAWRADNGGDAVNAFLDAIS